MHRVKACYVRVGSVVEGYRRIAITEGRRMTRRSSVHREIGRLNSENIDRIAQVDYVVNHPCAINNAVAGWSSSGYGKTHRRRRWR
jgi:hypothetical protein